MIKLSSRSAISLLELIIATALVMVVIIGMFAVNMVLNNNNEDYGQKYFVKSETQTTLNHILNNASLAIGSGINLAPTGFSPAPDQGILIGDSGLGTDSQGNNANSFCIHQDINPRTQPLDGATVNSPPTTPPYDGTSRWLCYTWYASGTNAYQIYYCAMPYENLSSDLPYRGAGSCSSITNPDISQTAVYLGTARVVPNVAFSSSAGGQMVFSANIINCLNNSISSCTTGGTSSDPADNPEMSITGSAYPQQEGMQQN